MVVKGASDAHALFDSKPIILGEHFFGTGAALRPRILNKHLLTSFFCASGLLLAACDGNQELITDETLMGVATNGPGFSFWLPWGAQPAAIQQWEPRAYSHLTVSIDEINSAGSVARHLRTFSPMTTPRLLSSVAEQGYGVDWNSGADALIDGRNYRITVFAEGAELGRSDIDPRYLRDLRATSSKWIKFRVEQLAVDSNLDGIFNWDDQCAGGTVDCDDGDPCTADSCESSTGCVHAAAPDGAFEGSGATACGAGACRAAGETLCRNGSVVDTCTPGQAMPDTSCNSIDDDCDGNVDEDYVSQTISCSAGGPTGRTMCANGRVVNDCPAAAQCTGAAIAANTAIVRSTGAPGAAASYEVCATAAGQRIAINTAFNNGCFRYTFTSPTGAVLVNNSISCGPSFMDALNLPMTGAYTLSISPYYSTTTGNATATLYNVTDLSGTAVLGAPRAPTMVIATPGQNARLFFNNNTLGQRVSIQSSRNSGCFYASVIAPSGAIVVSPNLSCGAYFSDLLVLNEVGQYTFFIDGYSSDTATFTTDMWIVPQDNNTSTVVGGANIVFPTAIPAQNSFVTFSGSATQRTSFQVARSTGCFNVRLTAPSGAVVVPTSLSCGTWFSELITLNESGNYTWLIDGYSSDAASYTFSSWIVPADPITAASLNGATWTMALNTPAQNGSYTFAGTIGARASINVARTAGCYSVTLTAPSGARPINNSLQCGNYFTDLLVLAENGTYTWTINPNSSDTATFTTNLYSVPADLTASTSIGGSAASLPMTTPGQAGFVTFTANAGQRVAIAATRTSGCYYRRLTAPSGATVLSNDLNCGNYNGTVTVAETGTFTLGLDPYSNEVPTFNVTVANAP